MPDKQEFDPGIWETKPREAELEFNERYRQLEKQGQQAQALPGSLQSSYGLAPNAFFAPEGFMDIKEPKHRAIVAFYTRLGRIFWQITKEDNIPETDMGRYVDFAQAFKSICGLFSVDPSDMDSTWEALYRHLTLKGYADFYKKEDFFRERDSSYTGTWLQDQDREA